MYRLTYFDLTGRAEIIRLLFVLAGVTFQDNRVQKADWPVLKPTTPWGQLPYLEEDGKILAQTVPIMHYLGQKFGLGGDDAWQQALVDSVCEASNDLFTSMSKIITMTDKDAKQEAVESFLDSLKNTVGYFERFIGEHGQNNYTVGSHATSADICIFNIFDQIEANELADDSSHDSDYPHILGVYANVMGNPLITKYLQTRKPDPPM